MTDTRPDLWRSRLIFTRGVALVYLIAFVCAANQFVPLLGEHGLLPVPRFVAVVPFAEAPSVFFFFPTDRAFTIAAWTGVALASLALIGLPERLGTAAAALVWTALWALYLSFMNVGQTFYGFGWESLLLETGFLTILAGGRATSPAPLLPWLWRWTVFRLMFGAGLIKLRGDSCWRDLTCLDYYYETQPMPNPLSWHFHWMPWWIHHSGVFANHLVELIVPFAFFAPQPIAGAAGLVTIAFQLGLIVSGNLSWLNWLTIVLALSTLDDRWWSWLPMKPPELHAPRAAHRIAVYALAALVAVLSVGPVFNMLSPNQVMNTSYNPLQIVNTYGAFGSITRTRDEIVLEGTADDTITERTAWREYEFKGKPGDPSRMPPQVAPYHLRIDWLMWFAAMGPPDDEPWFRPLLAKLLQGDPGVIGLLRTNPFPDRPPRYVRARCYRYRFTTPDERRRTGRWWDRQLLNECVPPVSFR
jgi:lipase maturation factor